jgi:flagellar hook-associated protein 1 FlgK
MTDGYATRDVELSSQTVGSSGGVTVVGISRSTDPVTTSARLIADGEVGLEEVRADFYETLTSAMGQADEESSITGQFVTLETSLIAAASMPESEARLNDVLLSAEDLVSSINSAADALTDARIDADTSISQAVDGLNVALQQVVDLNVAIQKSVTSGYDANSLLDQRQTIVDQISELIPVNQIEKDNGMIGLYTTGGAILVDSKAATLEFTSVPTIDPEMTIENGALSGLTINGQTVTVDSDSGMVAGGKLSGLFEVRDELIPEAQTQLDAIARDLIERFETSDTDSTLSTGDAGFFTDNGAALDTLSETGLANRLTINSLVDPDEGGDLWKIRDGLGATSEGEEGDATLLQSMTDALQTSRVTSSGGFTGTPRTASELSSDLYSIVETNLLNTETDLSFASARQDGLKTIELEAGVDTDYELQQLLLIEQSYAANAKVIETLDTLLNELLGML